MDKKFKDMLNKWTKEAFGEQVKKDLTKTTEELLTEAFPGIELPSQPVSEEDGLERD